MCANNKKACLQGARGQRLGSLHDCAWRKNQTLRAMTAARWLSSAATSSSELSELARSRAASGVASGVASMLLPRTFWMMWRRRVPKEWCLGAGAWWPQSAIVGRSTVSQGLLWF